MRKQSVNTKPTRPGINELPRYFDKHLKKSKLGVLCHPASINSKREHILKILENKRAKVRAIFGPQHGIYGETQDNMIEWQDFTDKEGRRIFSLYGKTRKPSSDSLKGIDTVVADLQDVGARYYTFIYTLFYMMEACAERDIPMVVFDRPNPIGGKQIEGPILDLNFQSFVGLHPIPVCHGMTVGELAQLFLSRMSKPVALTIVPMKNWSRDQHWPETGLDFVPPSPNIPSYQTCVIYPGMCLLEATTLSEGRGTTRPFELIGAPFIDWQKIEKEYLKLCQKFKITTAFFHRQGFIPTFHKYAGEVCHGALQLVDRPKAFKPYRSAVILLWLLRKHYGHEWDWTSPPYEYEYEKMPIDILSGDHRLRECVDRSGSLVTLFKKFTTDEKAFRAARREFLLYR